MRTIKHLFMWILIYLLGAAFAVTVGVVAAIISNNNSQQQF